MQMEQNWISDLFVKPHSRLIFIAAFAFGVACYWSDWAALLNIGSIAQEGAIIRNSGKAALVGLLLGAIFCYAPSLTVVAFVVPSFILRQIEIWRSAAPESNLFPLFVGADVLLSMLVVGIVYISASSAKWAIGKFQSK